MNKIMTPSAKTTTEDQINKAVGNYRALLEKHSPEFDRDAVQQALGSKGLATDMFAIFRGYVERFAGMIVRTVSVDRSRTPEQALVATGRAQHTDSKVVATMPKGNSEEVKVVFFKVGKFVSDDDLEKEYAGRNLVPADPFSLAAVNEAYQAFADKYPNGTHWKDDNGNWCFAAFVRWDDERDVYVRRNAYDWGGGWWFAALASTKA